MGQLFTTPTEHRVLILGIDGSGKTSILYQLSNKNVAVIPTIGFNIEQVKYKGATINFVDMRGEENIRRFWPKFYEGTEAVIFVIDSTDSNRLSEAKDELMRVLNHAMMDKLKLLVWANKQDLPNAMDVNQISQTLDLKNNCKQEWTIRPCSAANGNGLVEGLNWIVSKL